MNTLKSLLAVGVAATSLGVFAHPRGPVIVPARGPYGPAPMHRYHHYHHYGHHGREIFGIGLGLTGVGLITDAIVRAVKDPEPVVVVQQTPVVQQGPVIVQPTPVVQQGPVIVQPTPVIQQPVIVQPTPVVQQPVVVAPANGPVVIRTRE